MINNNTSIAEDRDARDQQSASTAGAKKRSHPDAAVQEDPALSLMTNDGRPAQTIAVAEQPIAKRSRAEPRIAQESLDLSVIYPGADTTASVASQQQLLTQPLPQQVIGIQTPRIQTTQRFISQHGPSTTVYQNTAAPDMYGLSLNNPTAAAAPPSGILTLHHSPQEHLLAAQNELSNSTRLNQILNPYSMVQPLSAGAIDPAIGTIMPNTGVGHAVPPFQMQPHSGNLIGPIDPWINASAAINQQQQTLLGQQAALGQLATMPPYGIPTMNMSVTPAAGLLGPQRTVTQAQGNSSLKKPVVVPDTLPVILFLPEDNLKLSPHQVLLRQQIEAFEASEDDISSHMRGRNKPITFGQVGIRCRHCAHLPVVRRQKGSTYFPSSTLGLYQAAQNMSGSHLQNGSCTEMPEETKRQFVSLLMVKSTSSGAGRPYWSSSAKKLGLVDTDDSGIRFIRSMPKKPPTEEEA